jgi:hypothetical protein
MEERYGHPCYNADRIGLIRAGDEHRPDPKVRATATTNVWIADVRALIEQGQG